MENRSYSDISFKPSRIFQSGPVCAVCAAAEKLRHSQDSQKAINGVVEDM
jgi:hypothetical protein